jgi:hypothetical protein
LEHGLAVDQYDLFLLAGLLVHSLRQIALLDPRLHLLQLTRVDITLICNVFLVQLVHLFDVVIGPEYLMPVN